MRKRSNKSLKKSKKIYLTILSILILFILSILGFKQELLNNFSQLVNSNTNVDYIKEEKVNNQISDNEENRSNVILDDVLDVYFIDVGQADSILLTNKEQSMLIDAGNNEDGEKVVNFIKEKGITKLNYIIGTHPHEDHIGGLDDVINNFEIENIYMPKIETTTKTFEEVIDAIENKNLKISTPKKGVKFNIGEAQCEIMTDPIIDKNNINLSSIIIKCDYGNNSFLFMGDAEVENEKTINWPKVDVLKVGHHGSNTSSSKEFLNQIKPKISVIMVGENNSYELPNKEILDRLNTFSVTNYRTDKDGTIKMSSDGSSIKTETLK